MKFQMFSHPVADAGELEELNAFLGTHRIVNVHQYFVPPTTASQPLIVFVVEYLDGAARTPDRRGREPRIDYKEKLTPEQFVVFDRLRAARKGLAGRDGVPVYAVFSNAQLAAIIEGGVTDESGLLQIEGVGAERVKKYGSQILKSLESELKETVS